MVGRQPNAPAAFTPRGIPGTHCLGWVDPRAHGSVGIHEKNPGTARLGAQCLNHCAIPGPIYIYIYIYIFDASSDTKFHQVGAELFNVDKRIDGRTDKTKLTVAFRDSVKELKKRTNLKMPIYKTINSLLLLFEANAHSHSYRCWSQQKWVGRRAQQVIMPQLTL